MKKVGLILTITLVLMLSLGLFSPSKAQAQNSFGVGLLANWGLLGGGGTPLCVDLSLGMYNGAIGWSVYGDGSGALYAHAGVLMDFYSYDFIIIKAGVQLFIATYGGFGLGLRIPIEANIDILPVPLIFFLGVNPGLAIMQGGGLTSSANIFQLSLSFGARFYL